MHGDVDLEHSPVLISAPNSGQLLLHAARSNHGDVNGGACMKYRSQEIDVTYTILARKTRGHNSEDLDIDIIKIDLEETNREVVEWIHLASDRE
jgi:hypothetical protein